jgi:EAL domain-containing protein (putative c-di-GMP-specific phosphodiesterase class I)
MLTKTSHFANLLLNLDQEGGRTIGRLGDAITLSSHFQPIYSLSHARVVGHEALLRARRADGQAIAPPDVFKTCRDLAELSWCDSLSRAVHLSNYVANLPAAQWLFLNVHPDTSQALFGRENQSYVQEVFDHFQISGGKVVIEVLESAVLNVDELKSSTEVLREHGCLIAIDDFGAGHSNFDRVWNLKPDIVKLDRSLVMRAALDQRSRRIVMQMVSLLHESGAMVLMEGVETQDEALLAMEADADMVQGYYFGRPQIEMMPDGHAPESLTNLYPGLSQRRKDEAKAQRLQLSPYLNAIGNAGVLLSAGRSIQEACRGFMELASTELCYVLNAEGYQISRPLWAPDRGSQAHLAYEPMSDSEGGCWARRPYFRRAVESPGKVQVTAPYRTLHGKHTCVTVSYAFYHQHGAQRELRVVCGDLIWD